MVPMIPNSWYSHLCVVTSHIILGLVCVISRIDGRNNGMSFLRLGYKRHCGFHLGYSRFTHPGDSQLLWRGPCRGESEASIVSSHVNKPLCRQVLQPLSNLLMITALASALTTYSLARDTLISGGGESRSWGTFWRSAQLDFLMNWEWYMKERS